MANLSERLREILTPQSPMHPIGCSTWEAEATYIVETVAECLDRLTVEGLAGVIFEALPDRSVWDGAERREINAEDDRTAKVIASKLLTYITGEAHD